MAENEKIYPFRVGVIGAGLKGFGHANGYEWHPRTKVVAIADTDAENRQRFMDAFGVPGYSDYKEMLAKERIDIAAPILPVSPNPPVVIGCAQAGVKAIYCEKPIAAKLSDADAMVEECKKRNIPFAAGDAYINMPQHWKVLDLIKSGELGHVQSINLYQSTIEISGGGCQGLSALRMFAGWSDIDWLTGWVSGDPWSNDDQNMGGVVWFANGVTGFIHNRQTPRDGLEVLCEKGVYFTDWNSGHLYCGPAQRKSWAREHEDTHFFDEFGGTEDWMSPGGTRQKGGIVAIVDAIEKGIEPRCSGDNLRKVLEIAIALRESARRGHAPVKLPLEDRGLALYPMKDRMHSKKEALGREWYDPAYAKASVKKDLRSQKDKA